MILINIQLQYQLINIILILQIRRHTISKSRKDVQINEYDVSILEKPIIYWKKFIAKMLNQFEQFFFNKEIVNMSSYKTDHWSKSVKSNIYQIEQNLVKILSNLIKFD